MNKKYALFGVAAVIAIAGVVYFGTGANQQASVANLLRRSKVVPASTTSLPIGCTSATGYSPKTGAPCSDEVYSSAELKTINSISKGSKSTFIFTGTGTANKTRRLIVVGDGTGGGSCRGYILDGGTIVYSGSIGCP